MLRKFKKIITKPDKEKEEKLRSDIERDGGVSKKDLFAMITSAYIVFLPIVFLVLLIFALVAFLFLR